MELQLTWPLQKIAKQRGAYHVLLFSATFQILLLSDDLFENATYKNWQNGSDVSQFLLKELFIFLSSS